MDLHVKHMYMYTLYMYTQQITSELFVVNCFEGMFVPVLDLHVHVGGPTILFDFVSELLL